jgi:thymidylate synthase (FAD)
MERRRRKLKIIKPSVEFLSATENCLKLIERAARTCYKSEDKIGPGTAERLVESCLNKNHMSVIEHASATFHIVCDRGVSHEIVRHRIASYSQESTRYCAYNKEKFGNEISVVEPPGLTLTQSNCWRSACLISEQTYFNLLLTGVTPQIARSVLPTCLKTEIVMTANFREWVHFINLRTSKAAHPQMREIATMIEDELMKICPLIFVYFNEANEHGAKI